MADNAAADGSIDATIVLNVMGLRELAVYGFRSWMLQDYARPYEVIVNLFYPCKELFEPLVAGANPNCTVRLEQWEEPEFFNISAANNLGLHLSRGKYVMFANSDIIYPGLFLSRAMAELLKRDIAYAVAARMNLTAAQCQKLRPPMQYNESDRFTSLMGLEIDAEARTWLAISPWMVRRDIAFAIGGFDKRVLVAEDRDIQGRAIHYLRRMGLQQAVVSLCDLFGYHQDHKASGLYDSWTQSYAVFGPRDARMLADPHTTEDIVDTPLNDREALLDAIRQTKRPPRLNQYRADWRGKLRRRAKRVWAALKPG